MGEWPIVRLEDLTSEEPGSIAIGPFGSRMKSEVYTRSGVPVVRGTNISTDRTWKNEWVYVSDDFANGLPNCTAREGDLVFPHRGSIGEVAIIPGDRDRYMLSTSLMKFRPDPDKISPLFLYYYFRSEIGRAEIMRFSSQVGTPGIGQPLTSLRQFRVPIPARQQQERMADILSALDARIELSRRVNVALEAISRAIYKDWFVDFGPTRAKAEGRDPYLAPELWNLFPDEIRGIPMGWEAGKVSDIAQQVRVGRRAEQITRDERYVGLEHFDRRRLTLWRCGSGSEVTSNKSAFETGDLLFGKLRPYFHKVAIAPFAGVCSTDVLVIRPKSSDEACFVYLALSESAVIDFVTGASTGTRMPRTNWNTLATYGIALPDGSVAREFHKIVSPMVERMNVGAEQARKLAELRDLLLSRLISGRLDIGEAEAMLAEAI